MTCLHCQASLAPGAKFCGQCGNRVATGALPPLPEGGPAAYHAASAGGGPATPGRCEVCRGELGEGPACPHCGHAATAARPSERITRPLGDRRVVTVLFVDVSGFTAMSEKLDPEAVTDIVNQFFKVLSEPITRFGGTIDKYMGDAIMAIFGAPVAHEDDPVRAVHAAWQMQLEAGRFAEALEERTGIRLKVRIGINTGLVIAGAVGSAQRSDYTVMGDTVNLAQRMESAATPGKVLVADKTWELARQAFDFQALEPIAVKGKADKVAVFELVGPRTDVDLEAGAGLVGREAHLQCLQGLLEEAFEGRPQVVRVVGEPGLGKSALVKDFVTSLRTWTSCQVRWGRCFSYDALNGFALIKSLLRRWFAVPAKASGPEVAALLAEQLEAYPLADPERTVALFAGLLAGHSSHPEVDALDPRQRRDAAFQALNELLVAEAAQGPLLLSLDDLQAADEESLEWLVSWLARLDEPGVVMPVLVVVQHRPEFAMALDEGLTTVQTSTLEVGPLAEAEGLALIGKLLGAAHPPQVWPRTLREAAGKVLDQAGGNPYFICELVRALRESGAIRHVGGRWHVDPPTGEEGRLALPERISGLVAARLDRLPTGAREILQVASVVGRRFDRSLLAEARPTPQLDEALAELVGQGLLRRHEADEYSFDQDVTQRVAYQSLLVKVRKEIHVKVATLLEKRHAGHVEEIASALARHYLLGEAYGQALMFLYLSGDWARRCFSNEKALSLLRESLEVHESLPRPPKVPALWKILASLAEVEATLGIHEDALQHLEGALTDARSRLPNPLAPSQAVLLAELHRARGELLDSRQDTEAAVAAFQEALATLRTVPEDGQVLRERALLLVRTGQALLRRGDADQAISLCKGLLAEQEAGRHDRDVAWAHGIHALALEQRGRTEDAAEARREALHVLGMLKLNGERLEAARIYGYLGEAYLDQGAWGVAVDHMFLALNAFRQVGDRHAVALLCARLALVQHLRGEPDEAGRLVTEAVRCAQELDEPPLRIRVFLAQARLLATRGELPEAEARAREALVLAKVEDRIPELAADAAVALGDVLLTRLARAPYPPEGLEAAQAFSEGCTLLREALQAATGTPLREARVRRQLSRLYAWTGRIEEALAMAGRAVNALKEAAGQGFGGDPLELALAYDQLHAVLRRLDRQELASTARHEAIRIVDRLGAWAALAEAPEPQAPADLPATEVPAALT